MDFAARVQVQLQAVQHGTGIVVHARLIDQAQAIERFAPEADVLRDAQVRHQRILLEDHGHAEPARIRGVAHRDHLAIGQDLALVSPVGAAQDLHQRGLARAVLAHHHVDLAGVQRQRDLVQRQHAGKAFGDAAQGQRGHGRAIHHCTGLSTKSKSSLYTPSACLTQSATSDWRTANTASESR